MGQQSHYIDVYGVINALHGMSRPDAVVTVTPVPYIANGKMQYDIHVETELAMGESDDMSDVELLDLVQNAAKACVNGCVADLMAMYATNGKASSVYNLYSDTKNRMEPGHRYRAVLVGADDAEGQHNYYLVRKQLFDSWSSKMDDAEFPSHVMTVCDSIGIVR